MSSDFIIGIDLGTTNSEVAVLHKERVRILGPRGKPQMLASCVGLSPAGELLVGEVARNQQLVYPERTVRSVKRLMGTDRTIELGDRVFSPPEISALILRELARWTELATGTTPRRAVITVPAYFSDAQRHPRGGRPRGAGGRADPQRAYGRQLGLRRRERRQTLGTRV